MENKTKEIPAQQVSHHEHILVDYHVIFLHPLVKHPQYLLTLEQKHI